VLQLRKTDSIFIPATRGTRLYAKETAAHIEPAFTLFDRPRADVVRSDRSRALT
jgi:hypothetical protein